jgi:hypothetical protein
MLMAITWTGLIITTTLIVARLYLRFKSAQQVKEQDASMGIALLSWVNSFDTNTWIPLKVYRQYK